MMNKMKVMVIAVLMGMSCLMAEEAKAYDQCSGTVKVYTSEMKKSAKINESKLTDMSYVKKICKITDTYKGEDYIAYELDGGKGFYIAAYDGDIMCVVVSNDELYGRIVVSEDGVRASYNMHDKLCHTSPKVDAGARQDITSMMEATLIYSADQLGFLTYIK